MNTFNWDAFFESWATECDFAPKGEIGQFVRDGIVCPDIYCDASPKIMFMLKESNNGDGDYETQSFLEEILYNKTSWRTWDPVDRWAGSLLQGEAFEVRGYSPHNSANYVRAHMKSVAVMNIKKASGDDSAEWAELEAVASNENHQLRIIEEIARCEPDIILACSKDVFKLLQKNIFKVVHTKLQKIQLTGKLERYNYGHCFDIGPLINAEKAILVVEYRHPSRDYCSAEEHHENMLKVRQFALGD